ncbi:MAG: glycosyltransferase [Bacteroidales bacterium]|nr:glycosyltransferase [Bacteroidales bacterium]
MGKALTVAVPAYNAQDFLGRCLDSLLIKDRQRFLALEVIVVNDGSTDGTSAIAHRYETLYPQVFRVIDKANGNSGSCINAALAIATGKYFRELDADDSFDTDALDAFIQLLDGRGEDVVSTLKTNIFPDGHSESYEGLQVDYDKTCLIDGFRFRHPKDKVHFTMHALSFRTDFLRSIGYRQTEGIFYTDMVLCYFPLKAARDIWFSSLCVYQYSEGRDGQSVAPGNLSGHRHDLFLVSKRLLDDYIPVQDSLGANRRRILLEIIYNYVNVFYQLSPESDPDREELDRLTRMLPELEYLSDKGRVNTPALYVCYSINDFFAREAGISIIGLLENNPGYEPEEIFILDYGIHPRNRERLQDIAAGYGRRITFLNAKPVTDRIRQEFPDLKGWRGSMAPNAKAFVEQIMPDYVERLLFIDADTVVAGSLAGLQHLDMGGAALAVVPVNLAEEMIRKGSVKLLNGNKIYFNSGVLLFDLPAWRREGCPQMIIDTLKHKIDLGFPDQSLLNNAIPERIIKRLPPKFNYITHYYHPRQERQWLRVGHSYTEAEIEECISAPAIIHYLGGWVLARPWHEHCRSSHSAEYFRYKALSPWKDSPLFRPYEESQPPRGFIQKLFFWYLKQCGESPSFLWAHTLDTIRSQYLIIKYKYSLWKQSRKKAKK